MGIAVFALTRRNDRPSKRTEYFLNPNRTTPTEPSPLERARQKSLNWVSNLTQVFSISEQRQRFRVDVASTPDLVAVSPEEQTIGHSFTLASVAVSIAAVGGVVYPPAALLSVPLTLYLAMPIFRAAYQAARHEKRLTMNTLDSCIVLGGLGLGNLLAASMGVWVHFVGRRLLIKTEDRSKQSLVNLFSQQQRTAWVSQDGVERSVPLESLQVGDVVVVNTGETLPIDGTIVDGIATIDQHILTGEFQPVERGVGDAVYASTLVIGGRLLVRVDKGGDETVTAQISQLLENTVDFRSSVQAWGQRVADNTAPPVIGLSGLTVFLLNPASAVGILYASFGYDLRITAPIAVLNFLRIAAENNMLIKDGRALELLHGVDTVVFDKTGTLTLEQPHVGRLYTFADVSESELLEYAAAVEARQNHPIAKAILTAAAERNLTLPGLDEARYEIGYGIQASINQRLVQVGSSRFMTMVGVTLTNEAQQIQQAATLQGHSLVYVAIAGELCGIIELHATIRPETQAVVDYLHQRNITVYIVSGDHDAPTRRLAHQLGVDDYRAETLPEDKAIFVRTLQTMGKRVCFVGDGINDSVALKQADVSISMRGASSLATDTAQIILMNQDLTDLQQLFDLASNLRGTLKRNLFITVTEGVVCVAGVYLFSTGVLSSLLTYCIGLSAGLGNSAWPLVSHAVTRSEQPTYGYDEMPSNH